MISTDVRSPPSAHFPLLDIDDTRFLTTFVLVRADATELADEYEYLER
jgi:hypothetical protein